MNKGWRCTTIQDFVDRGEVELKTGPFGTQLHASDYVTEGTPVINVRNIGFGTVVHEKLEYISDETVSRLASHLLHPEDIVFGRKGAVERHAFISQGQDRWFQGSDCLRLRVSSPDVVPRFLSYCFLTDEHKRWMMNQCSHGATMASLNQAIICRIPLRLPHPNTQRRIASILSAYDDLIANNTGRIKILEQMVQMLYREWFVNFRFPGHDRVRMVESEFGLIPDCWQVTSLKDLFPNESVVITGPFGSSLHEADYRQAGVPLVLVKHIRDGRISEDNMPLVGEHKLPAMARYRLQEGDVVVTRVGYVGAAAYISGRQAGWILSGKMLRVRLPASSPVLSRFLVQQYQLPEFQKKIENHAVGSTRMSLNVKILNDLALLLPSLALQERFTSFAQPVDAEVESLRHKNRLLRTTRDLLLPKLISGAIPVETAEEAMEQTA